VRALGVADERAASALGALITGAAPAAERADAARVLGRLGASGQVALADALLRLVPDSASPNQEKLLSPDYAVLGAVLSTLTPPPDRAGPALARLAALPLGESPALRRRAVALRCAAAALLAGRGTESRVLAACDPDTKGRAGRLARLSVLDRGALRGERLRQWAALAEADDAIVRERALELAARHDELDATVAIARALVGKTAGEVATAAHLLAEHPARSSRSGAADAPTPEVARALSMALEHWAASSSIEVRSNLMDAAGALGLLTVKARLEAACQSDNPTLRTHAEKALHALGDRERRCESFQPSVSPPAELAHAVTAPVRLELETDAGTLALVLDPALAPVAVTRLVDLAKAHFFDGVVIHRVVPGFVVQLGDPDGDGFGGVDRPPLRCETSPARFDAGSVGIALSGRDTGSSQFFVTLAREAHLDGEYALIGRAEPGWDRAAEGDIVKTVRPH
jgi:cyclophilin family peptidyl-prolyl cis-trans isomerase